MSFYIGIATTGLLVWTLWETRAASRRELRAYVSIKPTTLSVLEQANGEGFKYAIAVDLHNGGSTPAYDCIHFGNLMILQPHEVKIFFARQEQVVATGERTSFALHADRDRTGAIEGTELFTPQFVQEVRLGKRALYCFGTAVYKDTYGRSRRSDFCFEVSGQRYAVAEAYAKLGHAHTLEWRVAPVHNAAN